MVGQLWLDERLGIGFLTGKAPLFYLITAKDLIRQFRRTTSVARSTDPRFPGYQIKIPTVQHGHSVTQRPPTQLAASSFPPTSKAGHQGGCPVHISTRNFDSGTSPRPPTSPFSFSKFVQLTCTSIPKVHFELEMRPALALLVAASPALAAVRELWWNLTYVENANPDGLSPRRVIGVNGTWPCVLPMFIAKNVASRILPHCLRVVLHPWMLTRTTSSSSMP